MIQIQEKEYTNDEDASVLSWAKAWERQGSDVAQAFEASPVLEQGIGHTVEDCVGCLAIKAVA